MLSWCIILFGLGVLAFLDTIFNYGEIFRRINSVIFMLVSLGVLVRLAILERAKRKDSRTGNVAHMEQITTEKSQTSAGTPSTANVG